ncbi:hypothetical protein [Candidatus Nitrososphaera sp. FF02]|uniref:hypothetical protein n=1 Tax=Candidatus Nitrososphaera sp. FF02 TaxID=3398226 RepID=UPI0039E8B514
MVLLLAGHIASVYAQYSVGEVTISTTKLAYNSGDIIEYYGAVNPADISIPIRVQVIAPDGTPGMFTTGGIAQNGSYSGGMRVEGSSGAYTLIATYNGMTATTLFYIEGVNQGTITVTTNKQSYAADDAVRVSGVVSPVSGEEVLVQVYNPDGSPYRFLSIAPNESGRYSSYMRIGGPLGIEGQYIIVATFAGVSAETHFSFANKESLANVALRAYDRGSSTLLYISSSKTSNAGVYELLIELPQEVEIRKMISTKGWSYELDGDLLSLRTETSPLEPGKRLIVRMFSGEAPESMSWMAFDSQGELADEGTAPVKKMTSRV